MCRSSSDAAGSGRRSPILASVWLLCVVLEAGRERTRRSTSRATSADGDSGCLRVGGLRDREVSTRSKIRLGRRPSSSFSTHRSRSRRCLLLQPHHAACLRLVERLAEAGTRVLISDILLAEFAEGVYKVVLRERHGNRRWQRYWTDGRARRRAARLLAAALEDWQAMCTTLVWDAVALSEASDWVEALMSAFRAGFLRRPPGRSSLAAGETIYASRAWVQSTKRSWVSFIQETTV